MENCDSTQVTEIKVKHEQLRRTIMYIAGAVAILSIVVFICISIVKNNFSYELLLSTLLAIFSVVISIQFYFSSERANSKFYDSSYMFMKEQSNLLGRIEERFGAKFDSINSTLEHMSGEKIEISEKETEKDIMIQDFIEKLSISQQEKDSFIYALKQKDIEIERTKQDYAQLKNEMNTSNNNLYNNLCYENRKSPMNLVFEIRELFDVLTLQAVIRRGKVRIEDLNPQQASILIQNDIVTNKGILTLWGKSVLADVISRMHLQENKLTD